MDHPRAAIVGLWSGITLPGGFEPIYRLACDLAGETLPDSALRHLPLVEQLRARALERWPWLGGVPSWFTDRAVGLAEVLPFAAEPAANEGGR